MLNLLAMFAATLIAAFTPSAAGHPSASASGSPSASASAATAQPPIIWKHSRAIGRPDAGRLVNGVQFPAEGPHFFTWDMVTHRSPNRGWRRYGTDRLVRTVLRVIDAYAAAHPNAPRVGVGDLSRPHGGDFGPQYGWIGHVSHQNGLDVDIWYPRLDGRERWPDRVSQVNRRLSQDLVNRFVQACATLIFVGPNTGLHGPAGVVQPLANHDNHMHVRLLPDSLAGTCG
ncbi:MAG: penicillin-insensitive murein DD-endopeptidase [Gaiellales bacterium]|jgi:murein endopeptidase|nr:penicillin-insensitive murein DD-endopeptidase [Gaiellales bacterium]